MPPYMILMATILRKNSQISVSIGQKMQLTGWNLHSKHA